MYVWAQEKHTCNAALEVNVHLLRSAKLVVETLKGENVLLQKPAPDWCKMQVLVERNF
jgi:GH43 family beta-xylosidase